LISP
jgi:hypothetical protein